ncbi:polysaccharide lyase 8 family protein [Streptomyces sp. NPDC059740]|uniref:polysaccharide lyase 8 family protein n=1 Tax=Streptomyces sp. NPDC059740 TaxID=3346926 RepID=UPI003648676A
MPRSWSRRSLITTASGAVLATGITAGPAAAAHPAETPASPAPAAGAADYAALRTRWRELMLGSGFTPTGAPFRDRLAQLGSQASQLRAAMAPATGSLWPDAVFGDPDPDTDTESYGYSGQIQTSYQRLHTMAEAYAQPGTGLTGDKALADAVLAGLAHLEQQVYRAGAKPYGNWYSWQIGAPQALLDVLVLLHDLVPAEDRARYLAAVDTFVPDSAVAAYTGTSTGANRVDLCRVLALRGAVGEDAAKLALARDALSPVLPYVTSGDGLYADGSVVQHTWVPYTGSYGAVLIDGLSRLFALLAGSAWEVTDPHRQVVLDAVEHAYAPFLLDGLVMDGVSGRAVSRGLSPGAAGRTQQSDHTRGHQIIASVLLLAEGASAGERARWRALAKGWLRREEFLPVERDTTLAVGPLARLTDVLADEEVQALPEPREHRQFPAMDRLTHRTAGWAALLSMSSRRITYYETGNGENGRGWNSGSGMLYWWGGTGGDGQYSDAFWPTVDPMRLPGTTVSHKPLAVAEGGDWGAARPDVDYAGGATDGTWASAGQHLKGLDSTLTARKSFFFLDDAVVCLGAGITASDGHPVETVIDNRNLGAAGSALLTLDGVPQPMRTPWTTRRRDVRWAHLAGHAGYVLLTQTDLTVVREERTGAWQDVNTGGSPDPLTRRYVTLLAGHGQDPSNAGYAYLLMPGADAARTAARAADRHWVRVLANTAGVQAVRVPSLGFTGANLYAAGSAGELVTDGPASVTVREARGRRGERTAVLCVSDPTRTADRLRVTWRRPVSAVLSRPGTVTSVTTGAAVTLTFDGLAATAGVTQRTVVRLA